MIMPVGRFVAMGGGNAAVFWASAAGLVPFVAVVPIQLTGLTLTVPSLASPAVSVPTLAGASASAYN